MNVDPISLVSTLVEAGNVDTMYRDLYLGRARARVPSRLIPSDVHFRLGEKEGWGRQPCWIHFDGYLIRTVAGQVRLQALVGGGARYGGLYDLLGVGRDYDSDRLIARFAVVHRERMVAW